MQSTVPSSLTWVIYCKKLQCFLFLLCCMIFVSTKSVGETLMRMLDSQLISNFNGRIA